MIYRESILPSHKEENKVHYKPETITIERFSLVMPVKAATVNGNDWQIFPDAVSWLKTSGNLKHGNIVVYAHNYKDSFGQIIKLAKGDTITVTNTHTSQKFRVIKAYQTKPNDLTAIHDRSDRLTLYTCSGWFDANRFVVIAEPVN